MADHVPRGTSSDCSLALESPADSRIMTVACRPAECSTWNIQAIDVLLSGLPSVHFEWSRSPLAFSGVPRGTSTRYKPVTKPRTRISVSRGTKCSSDAVVPRGTELLSWIDLR
jgi:hypothetical protein